MSDDIMIAVGDRQTLLVAIDNLAAELAAFTKATVGLGNVDNTSDANKPVSTAQAQAIAAAISALTKASVGLSAVDNTADANKPVSTAQAQAISAAISALTKASVGLSAVNNTADADKPVSTAQTKAIGAAIAALTKASVGLGNVDNTADTAKPVSTAQAQAIAAAIAALTKASVGLGAADNTSDANKPVSMAQQAVLDGKAAISDIARTVGRPGDAPLYFTGSLAGPASAGIPAPGVPAVNDSGTVQRVTGGGATGGIVATRECYDVEPGRALEGRWSVKRVTDPSDPGGDTVQFAVQPLDANKGLNGAPIIVFGDGSDPLKVADGRLTRTATFALAGVAGVDHVLPAGTCYARFFIQNFGADGVTDDERIKVSDVTDRLALAASGDESVGAVANALADEITNRGETETALSNRTAILEGEIVRGDGAGVTIEDPAGNMLASIDPVAIHHPQIDRIDQIATMVGARVASRPGGGFAVEDARGFMLFEVTADAINHPVIQQLMVALTLTKQVGAGFSITDSLGNILIEVTPTAINHPMMAALSAASAVTKAIGDGFSIVDPAGFRLVHVGPTKIEHPQINQMAADLAPLAGATRRIGDGFAVEDGAAFRLLSVTPTDIKHPAISFLRASVRGTRDPQWDDIQAIHQIIALVMYGQSLSRGQSLLGDVIMTPDPVTGALRFVGGVRPDDGGPTSATNHASLVPFLETYGQGLNETPLGGMVRMILQLLHDEDGLDPATMGQQLLASSNGQNSQPASALQSGSAYFQRLKDAATYGFARAGDLGLTYGPGVMPYIQGENDYVAGTSAATYKSEVLQILSDYTSWVNGVTGVTRRIPMLTYQTSTHVNYGVDPTIAIAQLQMAGENALVGLASPSYPFAFNPSGLHFLALGGMHMGAFFGLAAKRWLWDGVKPQPFVPLVERSGKSIIAHFPVAVGRNVVLHSWAGLPNYGATIVDSSGTNIPITGVVKTGRGSVTFTTASAVPANAHLRLGWIGMQGRGFTGLRDDEPMTFDPTGWALPMWRWAPICDLTVS